MEKMKKVEKSSMDPHREFLDMDTDEEDFGRQGLFFQNMFFFRHYILYPSSRLIDYKLGN